MNYEEAIAVIRENYPTENYTMLREALDLAIEALGEVEGWREGRIVIETDER